MTTEQEKIDTTQTNETNETNEPTMNDNAFGDIPPTANIKSILGKTINVIGRYTYKIKHDPSSKYDKPDSEGMVTKYVIKTKQKIKVLTKDGPKDVSNWYVVEGHFKQLDKLASDNNGASLDKMFEGGTVSPDLVPCKKLGGQSKSYYTWLNPINYEKELKEKKIDLDN